jgi:putative transposase
MRTRHQSPSKTGHARFTVNVRQPGVTPEFVPFLDYSPEIRRVIYSTNAIESLNARFRRATRARGHFPNEQAAMKCLYLVVRSLDPKGTGQERWMNRWKPALNAFAITFEGRLF